MITELSVEDYVAYWRVVKPITPIHWQGADKDRIVRRYSEEAMVLERSHNPSGAVKFRTISEETQKQGFSPTAAGRK